MKLGIIAGNRFLPVLLAQNIKRNYKEKELIAICFKGESSSSICQYIDRVYWIEVGNLAGLRDIINKENLDSVIFAGQINPLRIFKKRKWDREMSLLIERVEDLRPHSIFKGIIEFLEKEGVKFSNLTTYLKEYLADEGLMSGIYLDDDVKKDVEFGRKIITGFVDLDVGQTIIIKKKSVVALESLEGTDRTILRGYRLAGKGCTILKFSKANQDLRFDVPVVGLTTLRLLRKVKARACVLEKERVIILEKSKFLSLAKKWNIPVVGESKV